MAIRIIIGDALTELGSLPAESVHCCVTSPPYYGLRDYGTATWEGGEAGCDHNAPIEWINRLFNANSTIGQNPQTAAGRKRWYLPDGSCPCGARRIDQQIGLEPSPDEYVAALVAVFREVRRVLRRDGTLWLNIGDSYNANQGAGFDTNRDGGERKRVAASPRVSSGGLPPKNLLGIPWRVAFALQADGWYLRQDIIWSKPNPMPESVTDRCTKAHEYLFLLSRSERYWFDAAAIAEDAINAGRIVEYDGSQKNCSVDPVMQRTRITSDRTVGHIRNKRSVWTVATVPFPEAHFATFPPGLIEPCIKAGCPEGGTVLDPFGGAGTTGLVADRLGRNAVLIELNPGYADMSRHRIKDDLPLFVDVSIMAEAAP